MPSDLLKRLRELGLVSGVRELPASTVRRPAPIESLVAGRFYTGAHGRCFVAESDYPLEHCHGELPLSAFLDLPARLDAALAAQFGDPVGLTGSDLHHACFLDTETTGLSGGAGTMAFVVGIGSFTETGFRLHQYFLRDPGDEPAMVEALAAALPRHPLLISFNGRAFDVPILETRFVLARMRPPTSGIPHLDLLLPARRLWRHCFDSCSLSSLERNVLGAQREQDDVPSGIIPELYRDYLRTGDAHVMQRVLYHNAFDIVSMVELAVRLCGALADPWGERGLRGGECYSLGRWFASAARPADAERAYKAALERDLSPELHTRTLDALGQVLKRSGRQSEAVEQWEELAQAAAPGSAEHLQAHQELAKHYEWHAGDPRQAADWTRRALAAVETVRPTPQRDAAIADLRHRLARLERKLSATDSGSPAED